MYTTFRIIYHLICFIVVFGLFSKAFADEPMLVLNDIQGIYYPSSEIQIYETNDSDSSIDDIKKLKASEWQIFDPSKELFPDKTYWFLLNIRGDQVNQHWFITPGLWHYSQLYVGDKEHKWKAEDMSVFVPLSERKISHNFPLFDLHLENGSKELLFKNQGFRYGRPVNAQHIWLVTEKYLAEVTRDEMYFQGGFLGFTLGLAGFHLILWLWFREKTYLWMVASGVMAPFFFHSLYGYGFTEFWPNFPVWNEYSASILSVATAAVYLRFGICYLDLSNNMPKLEKLLTFFLYTSLFAGLAVFQQIKWLLAISPFILMITAIIILFASIKLSRQGIRYAWYFVAGNTLVLLCFVMWVVVEIKFNDSSVLPIRLRYLTQLAAGIQGVFLALGMIDRMQIMRQSILQSKLNNEKLVRLQAEQTQQLMQVQNAELASANYALKEVDQLKDEFLAKTSHELNTPLNGIIGLTELLIDKQNNFSEKEKQEYLELIASRSEHLRNLVVELLEFAQTRRDVVKLYPEQINVESHIKKIIMTFTKMAQKKKLKLLFDESQHALVFVDARRFRQIISILIDNAIKYTDVGFVEIELSTDDKETKIVVKDSGIGISENNLEHVYEPFNQIIDKERATAGAGLGLSICKHLVELQNGRIIINSVEGRGSNFIVILPVNAPS